MNKNNLSERDLVQSLLLLHLLLPGGYTPKFARK